MRSYQADVAYHRIVYTRTVGSYEEPGPASFAKLTSAPQFRKDAVAAAYCTIQQHRTPYEQFLRDMAAAGVSHYEVDRYGRTHCRLH